MPLVIHERRNTWARQIRPRAADWPVRVVETRSTDELTQACAHAACPIVVLDLANRTLAALVDLERTIQIAPQALTLVMDPGGHREVSDLARELGASHVLRGRVTPPTVIRLLERWVHLAARRAASDGWMNAVPPDLEPWEVLLNEELETLATRRGPGSKRDGITPD